MRFVVFFSVVFATFELYAKEEEPLSSMGPEAVCEREFEESKSSKFRERLSFWAHQIQNQEIDVLKPEKERPALITSGIEHERRIRALRELLDYGQRNQERAVDVAEVLATVYFSIPLTDEVSEAQKKRSLKPVIEYLLRFSNEKVLVILLEQFEKHFQPRTYLKHKKESIKALEDLILRLGYKLKLSSTIDLRYTKNATRRQLLKDWDSFRAQVPHWEEFSEESNRLEYEAFPWGQLHYMISFYRGAASSLLKEQLSDLLAFDFLDQEETYLFYGRLELFFQTYIEPSIEISVRNFPQGTHPVVILAYVINELWNKAAQFPQGEHPGLIFLRDYQSFDAFKQSYRSVSYYIDEFESFKEPSELLLRIIGLAEGLLESLQNSDFRVQHPFHENVRWGMSLIREIQFDERLLLQLRDYSLNSAVRSYAQDSL